MSKNLAAMLYEPDTAPPYAAAFVDDGNWAVLDRHAEVKTIVDNLTETQAVRIAAYFNAAASVKDQAP